MPQIISVHVNSLWETCERWTYHVDLVTDEGFSNTLVSYRTDNITNKFEGLSRAQARDQALIIAGRWADLLRYERPPFVDKDGETYVASMDMLPYDDQRDLDNRPEGLAKAVSVEITALWETCKRWTYYVNLVTDEGFSSTLASYCTGSVYNNFEGLDRDEARNQALIAAGRWADFLEYNMPAYQDEDGKTYEPSRKMIPFTHRRVLAARKAARVDASVD